jgi:hypothetical protein
LGDLSELSELNLADNELTGAIPSEIGNIAGLTSLNLENNDLSGELPASIGNCVGLVDFDVSFNSLTGTIPEEYVDLEDVSLNISYNDMSGEISDTLVFDELHITRNKFIFEDIEDVTAEYGTNFSYAPQDKIGTVKNEEIDEGEDISFTVEIDTNPSGNDSYQWYKDGTAISGETSRTLVISDAETSDAGTYTYKVTNSVVTNTSYLPQNLVLESEDIVLTVNEGSGSGGGESGSMDVVVSLTPDSTDTETTMTIEFTPSQALTDGTEILVIYDTDFTGELDEDDITISGTNITSATVDVLDVGYFTITISTSADVTGEVSITVGDEQLLTTPENPGNYSVSVSIDIGDNDSYEILSAGLAYVEDDNDVNVTGYVPSVIDLEIYEINSTTRTNRCNLGVLSLNQVNTCSYDIGSGTNNQAGMTVQFISDGNLRSGGGDIDYVSDDIVTAGSEEYGVRISDDESNIWNGGTYETADKSIPPIESVLASTDATVNGIDNFAERLEITHKASMSALTASGEYTHIVTYIAYTN